MNPLDFTGRNVLVVGGSSGIGNGVAQAFRAAGARVVVWGTRASAADYDRAQGSDLEGLGYRQVDVIDQEAVELAAHAHGALDVLVLAQGTVLYQRQEFAMAGFEQVLDVNLTSMMTCASAFYPALKTAQGALIMISSVAGFSAVRAAPAYTASKHGVVGLTRALAQAWAGEGVRVNGVAPGLVDTKLTKATTENPKRLAASLAAIPLGRMGAPAEMAGAALFLASPLASYVIGQTLIVDGGLSL